MVQSCPDLILNLDLRGLNLIKLHTEFRNIETVRIESIILDNRLPETETLRMKFYKIGSLTISGVQVDSAVQVNLSSTFYKKIKNLHTL